MNEFKHDFDLKEIEKETRFMVDLINQNPKAFSNNPAGIPAVPLDIMVLAQNFASDKYLGNVTAYNDFMSDISDEQFLSLPFIGPTGDDVADYVLSDTLQGLTPAGVHRCFQEGIESHGESLSNLSKVASHYLAGRSLISTEMFGDYIQSHDFTDVFIANTERIILNQSAGLVRDAVEATRPQTALEIELGKILEENSNPSNPHDDVVIDATAPLPEFKARKRHFAGKTDATRESIKDKLTKSMEQLVKRLSNPELNESKKWVTATIPFSAYNVATGTPYSGENQSLAQMYSEECGYETGCYISALVAMKRGFNIAGATTQLFTQRYPIDITRTEIVNGVRQNKLNKDGTPETYKMFTIGYVQMMNIDELKWLHKDKPDPRIKMKEVYKKGIERIPCNQEKLDLFTNALLDLNYVKIQFGHSSNSYDLINDEIHMKHKNQFRNSLRFIHTMLHEMGHASGHKDRQNREKLYRYHEDVAFRGEEELTANRVAALIVDRYGLHESDLKDSYEANNLVYDLGWAKRAYEKNPLSLLDTIGNADFAFKELTLIIDEKLKDMNVLHLFQKQDTKFEGAEPKVYEAKKPYKSNYKSTYKKQVTA